MSDSTHNTEHPRRTFLRTATGLFLGASAPLDLRHDDAAARHRQWRFVPATKAWRDLEQQLEHTLADLGADEFLTIMCTRSQWYIQAVCEGRKGLWLEAGATDGSPFHDPASLPQSLLNQLVEAGWPRPEEVRAHECVRATRLFAYPPPADAAAKLAVTTLRGPYTIAHPIELTYNAFSATGREVRFPSLRLRRS